MTMDELAAQAPEKRTKAFLVHLPAELVDRIKACYKGMRASREQWCEVALREACAAVEAYRQEGE